jgi:branched-chain amino acid transport system permease protein
MTALAATAPRAQARGWRWVVGIGLIGGAVAIYLSLVGIVPVFNQKPLIAGIISLGQAALFATPLMAGFVAARRARSQAEIAIFASLAGTVTGAVIALLVLIGPAVNLRTISQHATPSLWNLLTFGLFPDILGVVIPLVAGLILGALAAGVALLPARVRESLVLATLSLVIFGLFAGLLRTPMLASPLAWLGRELFAVDGLTLYGAAITLSGALGVGIGGAFAERRGYRRGGMIGGVLGGALGAFLGGQLVAAVARAAFGPGEALAVGGLIGGVLGIAAGAYAGLFVHRQLHQARVDERFAALPTTQRRLAMAPLFILALLVVIVLPHALGGFFAQVVAFVALFMLMAWGLNITLGMAGLLDLGFVAFFAVGAYTVGLLTSAGPLGLDIYPFNVPGVGWWLAAPIAVFFAFLFGAFLGLPVLGIRGDYLAIATLGFGEIVRILVGSDLLKGVLGGPQGVTGIPRPINVAIGDPLHGPAQIYYLALIAGVIIAFLSFRLRDSRLGRAWLAIREDEDVAEALGINLVQTKLLAYSLGAAFAGLGGAIFAGLVGAVFASSINLLVSINVAAIVIIGGMGSIPGVVLGAVFLIGLPELFREFSEYRLLFYGAALVLVMRFRPEGLLPSSVMARELHAEEGNIEPGDGVSAPFFDKQRRRGPVGR